MQSNVKNRYTIQLPDEKHKTIRYVTLFILLINCFVFGYIYFNSPVEKNSNVSLMGMLISVSALVFFLIQFFTGRLAAFRPGIAFIILSFFWIILGNYLLALCVAIFAVFGFFADKKLMVVFDEDKITYPSFPVKYFYWKEISNVVLKDHVLTIDLLNNKLIQAVIDKASRDEVDEASFNTFCRKQVGAEVHS